MLLFFNTKVLIMRNLDFFFITFLLIYRNFNLANNNQYLKLQKPYLTIDTSKTMKKKERWNKDVEKSKFWWKTTILFAYDEYFYASYMN